MDLVSEIRNNKADYEALEAKYWALEAEKLGIEQQLEALWRENVELKERLCGSESKERFGAAKRNERVIDLREDGCDRDDDKVTQLMIVNKVLECEKEEAKRDAKAWESKFLELEARLNRNLGTACERRAFVEKLLENEEKKVMDFVNEIDIPKAEGGSASDHTPCKFGDCVDLDADCDVSLQARRRLAFEEEKSPGKKMAPSTPAGAKPSHISVVDISDSDGELKLPLQNKGGLKAVSQSKDVLGEGDSRKKVITAGTSLEVTNSQEDNEEDFDDCIEKIQIVSRRKRKRASNVVISDLESDIDDNIPICKLKKMNLEEKGFKQIDSSDNVISVGKGKRLKSPPRRRLVALRKCRGKITAERDSPTDATETNYCQGIPTNLRSENDKLDETGSESEGESLGGFIVTDSDNSDDSEGNDASSKLEDCGDEKIDFSEILSNLRREKERKFKWDVEADMLADFGKDTNLCMKAVCALYRQQTADEKVSKDTFYNNCRGFSKFDAPRGTNLAVFLTAGDPHGDLQKTEQELERHDPKGVKLCRFLATRYSKQLFEIYKKKEDPLFLT